MDEFTLQENGFTPSRVFTRHRCDPVALGVSRENGQIPYDWDNRNRNEGYLFQYTLRGAGHFQILPDGKASVLPPGTGFLTELPSSTRYWLESGRSWEFIYVILDGDMAGDLVRELLRRHGPLWNLPVTHPAVDILCNLHRQVCAGRLPDAYGLSVAAYAFLMELFGTGPRPDQDLSAYVNRALRHMEAAYADPGLSMAEIETAAGCSRHYLARRFRTEIGISPYTYLQDFRIQKALEHLHNSDKAVKEIAALCGYADTANFCREFKRRTRKTPTQARKFSRMLNLNANHTPLSTAGTPSSGAHVTGEALSVLG
ncbi:MAG: AraC family transcriptional regulator [Kiritimatiellia bacterium]